MTEKSTSGLERDAERVRADIADTADHLKAKMSPGQLMDEIVDYFKDGDVNQMVANLKHQVRDNPLALALVGGGLAWLMMGSGAHQAGSTSHGGGSTQAGSSGSTMATNGGVSAAGGRPAGPAPSHADRSRPGTTAGAASSALGEGTSSMKETAGSAAAKVSDAASSAAGKVSDTVGSAADAANRSLHDLQDSASDQMASASQAGAEMGERMKSSFFDALEREPLVVGALGVAVGAAIGAMVPVTRAEQENLGEASMKIRKEAESALSDGAEKAKGVAGEVYAAARDEADRQGLKPGGKPVAERAANVANAAGAKAKQAAERSLDETERSVDRATDSLKPKPEKRR